MRIGLVPLDERPCNELFPRMIGEIAGVSVVTPPMTALSKEKQPGDFEQLEKWLRINAGSCDVLILSIDQLVHGGLVSSRLTRDSVADCLDRLELLRQLKKSFPQVPFLGFSVITRIPNYNLALEEPEYWNDYGTMIFSYSESVDLASRWSNSELVERKLQLEKAIPEEVLSDVLWRRKRNHQINSVALDLVHEEVLDSLLLTLDDTSQFGLPRVEREILENKTRELGLVSKVGIHPGADEVACLLVSKALLSNHQCSPRYYVQYESPSGSEIVALYEDRPIQSSVQSQIKSSGGLVTEELSDADIILYVNTPQGAQDEAWNQDRLIPEELEAIQVRLKKFVSALKMHQEEGYHVAVADLAYANGADKQLIGALQESSCLMHLTSYGAWNTASNTLGTVVAHANARWFARTHLPPSVHTEKSHFEFLLLRLVDDWLYQSIVRTKIREAFGSPHELGENWVQAEGFLKNKIKELYVPFIEQSFLGKDLQALPDRKIQGCKLEHLRLPWKRTFDVACEVNVEIE